MAIERVQSANAAADADGRRGLSHDDHGIFHAAGSGHAHRSANRDRYCHIGAHASAHSHRRRHGSAHSHGRRHGSAHGHRVADASASADASAHGERV